LRIHLFLLKKKKKKKKKKINYNIKNTSFRKLMGCQKSKDIKEKDEKKPEK
jgi:hypothetical protein